MGRDVTRGGAAVVREGTAAECRSAAQRVVCGGAAVAAVSLVLPHTDRRTPDGGEIKKRSAARASGAFTALDRFLGPSACRHRSPVAGAAIRGNRRRDRTPTTLIVWSTHCAERGRAMTVRTSLRGNSPNRRCKVGTKGASAA